MLKIIVLLAFTAAACYAAPGGGTYCGETPQNVFACINSPKVVSSDVALKCNKPGDECDKMKCLFRESKWLDGNAVDKAKVSAHFDQYAKDHPEWSPAVQYLKAACLGDVGLKPQGVYLDCPTYDVMHCIITSFIKHATPSQWSTRAECVQPRAYATACPVCPDSCFSTQVPIGSCNACLSLPRSPSP